MTDYSRAPQGGAAAPEVPDTFLPGEGGFEVRVYQTTGGQGFRKITTTPFTPHFYTNREPLDIDRAQVRGKYQGLGVSLTDASCWLLSRLSADKRAALLKTVFSPTEGAGLRGIRLNIGSSDYSTALYTYNDVPGDVEMRNFSVARDDHWVFPTVREVLAINPDAFPFAAAWSPPGWMKTTGNFVEGNFKDGMEQALANYLAAYALACRERGVELRALSVNNESGLTTRGTYPSCVFSAAQEARVAKCLAGRLRELGLDTKIWIWDWDYFGAEERVPGELADGELRALVGGVAWHSYGDKAEKMYELKQKYPEIPFYHTEMGPALHDPRRTEKWWCHKLAEAFENGCEAFTGWNLCLTADGQPLTGPHLCQGLVTLDAETGEFAPSALYRLFRHIGPFVKDGAEVLRVAGDRDDMEVLLFRNPGGEYVLVAASAGRGTVGREGPDGNEPRPKLYIKCAGEMKHLPLPYDTWSLTTVVFRKR